MLNFRGVLYFFYSSVVKIILIVFREFPIFLYRVVFFRFVKNSFIITFVLLLITISAIARMSLVPTGSMEPTIEPGDLILATKYNYGFKRASLPLHFIMNSILPEFAFGNKMPERGDVVLFWNHDTQQVYVKRAIAIAGDTISISNGIVVLNHVPLDYRKLERKRGHVKYQVTLPNNRSFIMMDSGESLADNMMEIIVPRDSVFVMGDNSDNSQDSRFIGPISIDNIIGKARMSVISFSMTFPFIVLNRIGKVIA